MSATKMELIGYQMIEKKVLNAGHSGRVFVPKAWIGKSVAIVLKEPIQDE